MDYNLFRSLVAKWVAEKVIPAIVPEGAARWVASFFAMAKVGSMVDAYASCLPVESGVIDLDAVEVAMRAAFEAQGELAVAIPSVPQLAALGLGEVRLKFTMEDAASLMSYLRGSKETVSVPL